MQLKLYPFSISFPPSDKFKTIPAGPINFLTSCITGNEELKKESSLPQPLLNLILSDPNGFPFSNDQLHLKLEPETHSNLEQEKKYHAVWLKIRTAVKLCL